MDDTNPNPEQEQEDEMTTEENLRGDAVNENAKDENDMPEEGVQFQAEPRRYDKGR